MSLISIITVTRNRCKLLSDNALSSLLKQTCFDFEWIVINDGGDIATRNLIEQTQFCFKVIYKEIIHPEIGFALCHGRNLGISLASNDHIVYLDDDNTFSPDFIIRMTDFISARPNPKFSLPLQRRSRQAWQNEETVVRGKTFTSPQVDSTIEDLVCHRELFDSNGFTHRRQNAPSWNAKHRIYCDYEYFLQCLSSWGQGCFKLNPEILVNYVQSSQGIIGRSNYGDWAKELKQIIANASAYQILNSSSEYLTCLQGLEKKFRIKYEQQLNIPAFGGKL